MREFSRVHGIAGISGERLVASLARQHHRDRLRAKPRDKVERDAGGPHDRLILMPDQTRQALEKIIAAQPNFVMFRAGYARPLPAR